MAENINKTPKFIGEEPVNYNTAVSASLLHNDNKNDDQVLFLYSQLMNLPFSKVDTISLIEKSLYTELSKNPQDTLALIALMQVQTSLGNREKAKALAYKIWEVGSKLLKEEDYVYINNLLNLGLLEMASTLLKPRFENLSSQIEFYYPMLLKLSTMTGSCQLVERLVTHPNAPEKDDLYQKIISRYKSYNYADHFKNVQRIIIETVKDRLCVYDYDILGPVMEEIEITMYLTGEPSELQNTREELEEKLAEYYKSANIEKLSSFSWRIKSVSSHPAIGFD